MIKLTDNGLKKVKNYRKSIKKSLTKEQNQKLVTNEAFIESIETMGYASKLHIKDLSTNKSMVLISDVDFIEKKEFMKEKYEKIIKDFLIQERIKIQGHDLKGYCHSLESYIFDNFEVKTIVFNNSCGYDSFSQSHKPYLSDRVYSEKEIGNPDSYFRKYKVFKTNENIDNYMNFVRRFNDFVKEYEQERVHDNVSYKVLEP